MARNCLNLFASYGTVIGKYNATTGATINGSIVSGLTSSEGLAVVGGNLFYVDEGSNPGTDGKIGEITTAGATVNANLVTGLSVPFGITAIPEPSTYAVLCGLAVLGLAMARRHSRGGIA